MKPKRTGVQSGSSLNKSDIYKHGPEFLKESSNFCDCSKINKELLHFTLKCVSDLIRDRKVLRMSPKNTNAMKEILTPHKTKYLALSTPERRGYYVSKLRNQRGSGVFTAILTAVVPVIASLISKLIGKKK